MFRQSFAPVADLGAGRLQLAQATLQRDYAQRQQEAQRAQALRDHLAGLEAQNRFAMERQNDAQQNAVLLANLQGQQAVGRDLATARRQQLAQLESEKSRKVETEARNAAAALATARQMQAEMGITDVDETDPDYVKKVTKRAAEQSAKLASTWTKLNAQREAINKKFIDAQTALQLSEADARNIVLNAWRETVSGDAKALKRLETFKTKPLDEVRAAAAEAGADAKAETALARKQAELDRKFGATARDLARSRESMDNRLRAHEGIMGRRGIAIPEDIEVVPAADAAAVTTPAAVPLSSGELFPNLGTGAPATVAAPAAAPASDAGTSNWLTTGTAAALGSIPFIKPAASATASALRSLAGSVGRSFGSLAPQALRAGAGATPMGPLLAASLMVPETARGLNTMTNDFLPNSIAGLMGAGTNYFGDALQQQRSQLALIDQLIARASGSGDIETARRLRAAKFAPNIDDVGILSSVVQNPGDAFALPNGMGMSR